MSAVTAKTVKLSGLSTCRSAPSFSFGGRWKERTAVEVAPGPGKYGVPSNAETTRRAATAKFGSGIRAFEKEWNKPTIPGPGSYSAIDPNQTPPVCSFGSATRPNKKPPVGPEPGAYSLGSTLTKRGVVINALSDTKPRKEKQHFSPPPGHYGVPKLDGVRTAPANTVWSKMTEDRGKTDFTKNTVVSPDPGTYPPLPELGGNICTRTSPAFSLPGRARDLKPDNANYPGPYVADYSSFG
mmetsp:Transcript_107790/g.310429  ORF Transcript_107790/g.310429 Transcript_107790/m.310429 type:complete len:240 (-) Transcript_107790:88-807(-)